MCLSNKEKINTYRQFGERLELFKTNLVIALKAS